MLIWDNNFIKPYESSRNIINKICYFNSCSPNHLESELGRKMNQNPYLERGVQYFHKTECSGLLQATINIVGEDKLDEVAYNIAGILSPFFCDTDKDASYLMDDDYKYCPKCISEGYHSIFHQLSFINECVFHNIPLVNVCPVCGRTLSSVIDMYDRAYTCPHCGNNIHNLLPIDMLMKAHKELIKEIKIPVNKEYNANIAHFIALSKNKLTKESKQFIFHYLLNGKKTIKPTISLSKDSIIEPKEAEYYDDYEIVYPMIIDKAKDLIINIDRITPKEIMMGRKYIQCTYYSNNILLKKAYQKFPKVRAETIALNIISEFAEYNMNEFMQYTNEIANIYSSLKVTYKKFLIKGINALSQITEELMIFYIVQCYNLIKAYLQSYNNNELYNVFSYEYGKLFLPNFTFPDYIIVTLENDIEYLIYTFKK